MKFKSKISIAVSALAVQSAAGLSGCASVDETEPAPVAEQAAVVEAQEPAEVGPPQEVELPVVPVPPEEPEQPSYNTDDVLWIQQRLQELGYYKGSVDGAVGAATRDAVKAYQRDQGLQGDGQPTAELRDFMWRNGG